MASKPYAGITVVALEHAVAAPYCTSRLADAGARVIKVERPEGDVARRYDALVHGESTYFVWVNRGKESIALDLRSEDERAQLRALVARADVFIQNLGPGAAARLGFDSKALREALPRLVTCDIFGYGESGPLRDLKASDLLVQAESGLIGISGTLGPWGRAGVSICDIAAGMNALIGIQQALAQRERSGRGSGVEVSVFDSAAELMAVPYLQARYGSAAPERAGLKHPSVAPYGAFTCRDGREFVVSIQNDREWANFCERVLLRPRLANDTRFATNGLRAGNRAELEALIQRACDELTYAQAVDRLTDAQTAYGTVNSVHDLIEHPQLRTRTMAVDGRAAQLPATPYRTEWDDEAYPPAPRIDEHGPAIRKELGLGTAAAA